MTCIDYQIPTKLGTTITTMYTRAKRGQTPCVGELRKRRRTICIFILFYFIFRGGGHTKDIRKRRAYVMRC
jgi:hypothetical protein